MFRREKEERIREYEEKERERQIQRQKKQGLNQLWMSGKSVVTIEDNPDHDDEDLLLMYQQPDYVSIVRSRCQGFPGRNLKEIVLLNLDLNHLK